MMKMIIAIVRSTDLKKVEAALLSAGAQGLTVTKVKGIGEEKAFLEQNLVAHVKFEVIVPAEAEKRITEVIVETAWTGCAGDGIISVLPVETFIKVREKGTGYSQA